MITKIVSCRVLQEINATIDYPFWKRWWLIITFRYREPKEVFTYELMLWVEERKAVKAGDVILLKDNIKLIVTMSAGTTLKAWTIEPISRIGDTFKFNKSDLILIARSHD